MGWITRGNGRYYYRKRWVNGRAVNVYIGAGMVVEALADLDTLEQLERQEERDAWREKLWEVRAIESAIVDAEGMLRQLTAAVLLVNGYHSHKRQWRLERRMPDLHKENSQHE